VGIVGISNVVAGNTSATAARIEQPLSSRTYHLPGRPKWVPAFWVAVAGATCFGAFVLPFFFAYPTPTYSPAYTAGSRNVVAAIAVAAIAALVTLVCWRFHLAGGDTLAPTRELELSKSFSRFYLYFAIVVVLIKTAVFGYFIVRSGLYYADAGYLMWELRTGLTFHGTLYRDFEINYGPLFYYFPAMVFRILAPLRVSLGTAYFLSLAAFEAVGTALLFYTVQALPMTRAMKIAAFFGITLTALDPQAGMNYSPMRFVLPFAGAVLLSKQRTLGRSFAVTILIALVEFAVSPELGVVFTLATVAYAIYRAVLSGSWNWLFLSLAGAAGAVILAAISGPAYFRAMKEFASGGFNIIVSPAPHIGALLYCAVVLAPLAVAWAVRWSPHSHVWPVGEPGGMMVAIFVAGLAMLTAALGRCDPLHVAFNGWGLYLLAFVAVGNSRLRWRIACFLFAALFGGYTLLQEYALCRGQIRQVLNLEPIPFDPPDLPGLEQAIGNGRVFFPFTAPMRLSDYLLQKNQFQPGYGIIIPVTASGEDQLIQYMRRADFALVPTTIPLITEYPTLNQGLLFHLRFNYRYKVRHEPFWEGARTVAELQANWVPEGNFGPYLLYRKLP